MDDRDQRDKVKTEEELIEKDYSPAILAGIQTYALINGPPDSMIPFNLNSDGVCDLAVAIWQPELHNENQVTHLGTMGFNAIPMAENFRVELTLDVKGFVDSTTLQKLAEALIATGTKQLRAGCPSVKGQVFNDCQFPLFKRFKFFMLMDWHECSMYKAPPLGNITPLKIVPLFDDEANWIEKQPDRRQGYFDLFNRRLDAEDFQRCPIQLQRLSQPKSNLSYVMQIKNAFTTWNGAPSDIIPFNIKAEGDLAVLVYLPEPGENIIYSDDSEEACPSTTMFATAGLSSFPIGDFFHTEMMIEFRGCILPEVRLKIAEALVWLVTEPLKTKRPFKINQILSNFEMPMFENFKFAMLVDWDSKDHSYLFDAPKDIILLRIVALFESEATYLESQEDRDGTYRNWRWFSKNPLDDDDYNRKPIA